VGQAAAYVVGYGEADLNGGDDATELITYENYPRWEWCEWAYLLGDKSLFVGKVHYTENGEIPATGPEWLGEFAYDSEAGAMARLEVEYGAAMDAKYAEAKAVTA
jgi:hypothetical protein